MSHANLQNSLCKIKLRTLNFSFFSKSTLKGDLTLDTKHIKLKKLGEALVTDRWTEGPTKRGVESRSMQLKTR